MGIKFVSTLVSTLFIVLLVVATTPQTHAQPAPEQQVSSLQDGDLIQVSGEIDVYIVKIISGKHFKRLILNPEIFNSYGHLRWDTIQQVAQSVADRFQTSNLVKEVYPNGTAVNNNTYALFPHQDTGIKRLVVGGTYDPDSVYNINHLEAGEAFYATGEPITLTSTTQTQQPQQLQQPQQTSYVNEYLAVNAIQNTAQKRDNCSSDLLGLENIVGNTLLIPNDVCIRYVSAPENAQSGTILGSYEFNKVRGVIEIYVDKIKTTQQKQHALLHELCHANQHYHLQRNPAYAWDQTPAGQQFIAITRYSHNEHRLPQYKLPSNSIFLGKYGEHQPVELAADICAMLLSPTLSTHRYSQTSINTITSNADVLNWFNTYVLYSAQSPEPVPPLVIQPLTQTEKEKIYNDINLVVGVVVNGTRETQETLELTLYMLMGYNEQARLYVLSIFPALLTEHTVALSTNSNQVFEQVRTLQNELNELSNRIDNLKQQIQTLTQQPNPSSAQINDLISQHNQLVDQYNNNLVPQIQEKANQARIIREQEIKNQRAARIIELLQEWLNQLIETGEV